MAFSEFLMMNNHIASNGCLFILHRARAFRSAAHFRLASVDCTVIRAEERPLKYYSQCLQPSDCRTFSGLFIVDSLQKRQTNQVPSAKS